MEVPSDLRYTREHEWVRVEDAVGVVGITDHAQDELGDIVFVDLPEEGSELLQFEKLGEIESVKAVSDLFAPVTGEVIERNTRLEDEPELVNRSPYGEGWMLKVTLTNPRELEQLMTADEYERYVREETGE
ncbi:MAG TPA: glycine cleavage system protein GcvH [Dehalococcoidia bacterium]|nr:glycine cleavage system protein GcvH [Dehalococcoidia bacterium]